VKFLLDESTEYRIAAFLTDQGHDVAAIAHDYPAALPDGEVLAIAQREQRVLITNDPDFGELVFRYKQRHSGVILFRMGAGNTPSKVAALGRVLHSHADRLHQFLVIDRRGVRVRRVGRP
jgi:predicted nuclease of predicted toxin-antitoxin system